jgi:DNA-binding NarL/FixJ family response regulator
MTADPLINDSPASPTVPEQAHHPLAAFRPARQRWRLMIADDDPVIGSIFSMSLGDDFEVVAVAADSEEAIEVAKTSHPDAAIVDVDMPKGGGLRAVRGILEVSPDTAIVVLSGDESDAVVRELMAAGAIAYRRKGVSPEALAECLRESIRAHASERQDAHGPNGSNT